MDNSEYLTTLLWLHLGTIGPLIAFKIAALLVGYLVARLGFQLLVMGVKGEFRFRSTFKAGSVDLISVSPGLFFTLMATVIITVGVLKDKPFETSFSAESSRRVAAPIDSKKPQLEQPAMNTKGQQ
ncbi:hypothetical protein GCM10011611_38900 [Aliidongia dinghuensis]|uniref:Uncharacterized protein n=1 Tax=Aliidongia dinghuensis TaxID=1867774 RepID=A0A8J2YWC4_9PROT|nr:hypothetical protein [Aliidongia dinghuensis]GGF29040.1 hypothetical protein GCM10011611_38900 [Aliidongia dinghuensis]